MVKQPALALVLLALLLTLSTAQLSAKFLPDTSFVADVDDVVKASGNGGAVNGLLVEATEYHGLSIDYDSNSTGATANTTRVIDGSLLTITCPTGVQGSFVSIAGQAGFQSNTTFLVNCGTLTFSAVLEWVAKVPRTVTVIVSSSASKLDLAVDGTVAEMRTNIEAGNNVPEDLGLFGTFPTVARKRSVRDASASVGSDHLLGHLEGAFTHETPYQPAPASRVVASMDTGVMIFGDAFRHFAIQEGHGDKLKLVNERTISGNGGKVMSNRYYWTLDGLDEDVPATVVEEEDLSGNRRKRSEGTTPSYGKGTTPPTPSGARIITRVVKKAPSSWFHNAPKSTGGEFPFQGPLTEKWLAEQQSGSLQRQRRNGLALLMAIFNGGAAQAGASYDSVRSAGGDCANLNFVTGFLGGKSEKCQFQLIDDLNTRVDITEQQIALLIEGQLTTAKALNVINEILGVLQQEIDIQQQQILDITAAVVDQQFRFATLAASTAKQTEAINLLALGLNKLDANLQALAFTTDANFRQTTDALAASNLATQESFILAQNEMNGMKISAAAGAAELQATIYLTLAKVDLSIRESMAEMKLDSDSKYAANVDSNNLLADEVQSIIRDLVSQVKFLTESDEDHGNAIMDLQQHAFSVGLSVVELYIYLEMLSNINITTTMDDGSVVHSTYKLMSADDGIPNPDVDANEVFTGALLNVTYLAPVNPLNPACPDSSIRNQAIHDKLAATLRIKSMVPVPLHPESVIPGFRAITNDSGISYVEPPSFSSAQTYILAGVLADGTLEYFYPSAGVLVTTQDYSVANAGPTPKWYVGFVAGKEKVLNDAIRSMTAVIFRSSPVSPDRFLKMSGANSSILTSELTSSSSVFYIEPQTDRSMPGDLTDTPLPEGRGDDFTEGIYTRHAANVWLNPGSASLLNQVIGNPGSVVFAPPNSPLYLDGGGGPYYAFQIIDTRFGANNDSDIIEYPLTEAQRNATVEPVVIVTTRRRRDVISEAAADIVATPETCHNGIRFLTKAVSTPSDMDFGTRADMIRCIDIPGCQYAQYYGPAVAQVMTVGGTSTGISGSVSYTQAQANIISRVVSPPSATVYSKVGPVSGGSCSGATGRCGYVAKANQCALFSTYANDIKVLCQQNRGWVGSVLTPVTSGAFFDYVVGPMPKTPCTGTTNSWVVYCPFMSSVEPFAPDQGSSIALSPTATGIRSVAFQLFTSLPTSGCAAVLKIPNSSTDPAPRIRVFRGKGYPTNSQNSWAQDVSSFIAFTGYSFLDADVAMQVFTTDYQCTTCPNGYGGPGNVPINGNCPPRATTGAGDYYVGGSTGPFVRVQNFTVPADNAQDLTVVNPTPKPFYGSCVPFDRKVIGNSVAHPLQTLRLPYMLAPNDTGGITYTDAVVNLYVHSNCDTYTVSDCKSDQAKSNCKIRISVNMTARAIPATGYIKMGDLYQGECVRRTIPDRCMNFTTRFDCQSYLATPDLPSLRKVPICGWDLFTTSCRELDYAADELRMTIPNEVTLLAHCDLRIVQQVLCAPDDQCYLTIDSNPGGSATACQAFTSDSILGVNTSSWLPMVSSVNASLTALTTLVGSARMSFIDDCLFDGVYCLVGSNLAQLRLYELLNVAYPILASAITCNKMTGVANFYLCPYKKLLRGANFTTTEYAGSLYQADQVVSSCAQTSTNGACANRCSIQAREKNWSRCLDTTDDNCYLNTAGNCRQSLLDSAKDCPGLTSQKFTSFTSGCKATFNRCSMLSALHYRNGTLGNFTAKEDFYQSQCVQLSGQTCGNVSLFNDTQTEARIRGAKIDLTGPNSFNQACVVFFDLDGPVCYPKDKVGWCTLGATPNGCSPDVCTLNTTEKITAEIDRIVGDENCMLYSSSRSRCLLARRTDALVGHCDWVSVTTSFGYCRNNEVALSVFGGSGNAAITVDNQDTYFNRMAVVSKLLNATLNEYESIGIMQADLVVPPPGKHYSLLDPQYMNKIIVVEGPQVVCPPGRYSKVSGVMCCIPGTNCKGNNVKINPNDIKWIDAAASQYYCPTSFMARRFNKEQIYTSYNRQRTNNNRTVAPTEYIVGQSWVDGALAAVLFPFTAPDERSPETIKLRGRKPQTTLLGYPLGVFDPNQVVGNVTYPGTKDTNGTARSYPVFAKATYPTYRDTFTEQFTFAGAYTFKWDRIMNISMVGIDVDIGVIDMTDVVSTVKANPSNINGGKGWLTSSQTALTLQKYVTKINNVVRNQMFAFNGPYLQTYGTRSPSGCVPNVLGPGTAPDGSATVKTDQLICAFYENHFVDVYRVAAVNYRKSGYLTKSTSPNTKLPFTITVDHPPIPEMFKENDLIIFTLTNNTIIAPPSEEICLGCPNAVGTFWTTEDDIDPVKMIATLGGTGTYQPLDALNAAGNIFAERVPGVTIDDPRYPCGDIVTAMTTDQGFRRERVKAIYNPNGLLDDPRFDISANLFVKTFGLPSLELLERAHNNMEDLFVAAGCQPPFVDFERVPGVTGQTFISTVVNQCLNVTSGLLIKPCILNLMNDIADGQDDIRCGNCVPLYDPFTGQPIFKANAAPGDPLRGCNPLYGTTRPNISPKVLTFDSQMAKHKVCAVAFKYKYTTLKFNGRAGGLIEGGLRSTLGTVQMKFIEERVGTIYHVGANNFCGLAVNRTVGVTTAGNSYIFMEVTNPESVILRASFYVTTNVNATTNPGNPEVGWINITSSVFNPGDSQNFVQYFEVLGHSTELVPIPISSSDVYYVQMWKGNLASNCTPPIPTGIDYNTYFTQQSDKVILIESSIDTKITGNRRILDLGVENKLDALDSNITFTKQTILATNISLSNSIGLISGQVGGVIIDLTQTRRDVADLGDGLAGLTPILNNITDNNNSANRTAHQAKETADEALELANRARDDSRNSSTALNNTIADQAAEIAELRAIVDAYRIELDRLARLITELANNATDVGKSQDPDLFFEFGPGRVQAQTNFWNSFGWIAAASVAVLGLVVTLALYGISVKKDKARTAALGQDPNNSKPAPGSYLSNITRNVQSTIQRAPVFAAPPQQQLPMMYGGQAGYGQQPYAPAPQMYAPPPQGGYAPQGYAPQGGYAPQPMYPPAPPAGYPMYVGAKGRGIPDFSPVDSKRK